MVLAEYLRFDVFGVDRCSEPCPVFVCAGSFNCLYTIIEDMNLTHGVMKKRF